MFGYIRPQRSGLGTRSGYSACTMCSPSRGSGLWSVAECGQPPEVIALVLYLQREGCTGGPGNGAAVMELEMLASYAVGYLIRKWRRAVDRADAEIDQFLDEGIDQVHDLVSTKLESDTALAKLEEQALVGPEKPRTRERVEGAIIDAAEDDPGFAEQLEQVVAELRTRDTGPSA